METLGLLRLRKISWSCTVVLGVIILATCTCFVHDLWAVHSDEREQRIDQHGHLTSHVTQKTVPLQEPTETYTSSDKQCGYQNVAWAPPLSQPRLSKLYTRRKYWGQSTTRSTWPRLCMHIILCFSYAAALCTSTRICTFWQHSVSQVENVSGSFHYYFSYPHFLLIRTTMISEMAKGVWIIEVGLYYNFCL